MPGIGSSNSVRRILDSLPVTARAGSGRFSCVSYGAKSRLGWRFAFRPSDVVRFDTPDGLPHTIRWADGRELYDFGNSEGPFEVRPEPSDAGGWRNAPGVPQIEAMLKPRTLDRWMALRDYSLAERPEQGCAPWGTPTRIFDLTLGEQYALRLAWDEMSGALIELVHEPDPAKYSMTIDEWDDSEPPNALFAWDGLTRPAYSWPTSSEGLTHQPSERLE